LHHLAVACGGVASGLVTTARTMRPGFGYHLVTVQQL
jgi:hypothetical protein